jgi:signal transduction histidine kinase
VNRLLQRLLPAGFRGQVAGILLLGLALSQAMAAVLYMVLVPQWQRVLRPELAVEKVAMIVRLLEAVPQAQRPQFAALWRERQFQVELDTQIRSWPVGADAGEADPDLRNQLAARLGVPRSRVRVSTDTRPGQRAAQRIQVLLPGSGLLAVITSVGFEHRLGLLEQIALVAFLCFALAGLWAWLTWTVNAPLTRFAHAAERVGLDVHAPALPEQGPAQLKRAIRAFNEMQVRLQHFLSDRTRMLGAISHDLRTPLTRLRLRIETDRAAVEKDRMLADIETMESMLSSALAFIRGVEEEKEPTDLIDLDSLLQTACDVMTDLGGDVSYEGPARCRYRCKPQAMTRALINVISNAVRYGERAQVTLQQQADGYLIEVADEGPGIADTEKHRVFEPFYRTAAAQESHGEGIGLGLSIARSIILAHGGSIALADRVPQGLIVRVFLPVSGTVETP